MRLTSNGDPVPCHVCPSLLLGWVSAYVVWLASMVVLYWYVSHELTIPIAVMLGELMQLYVDVSKSLIASRLHRHGLRA